MGKKRRSWAQIQALHSNSQESVTLVLDTRAATEAKRLAETLDTARDGERLTLAKRVKALEDKANDSSETFTFEAVGGERHELMVAEHPPTDEQKKAAPEGMTPRWNVDTFPPALAAACCVEPLELRGNVAAWDEIRRTWAPGQWARLWGACLAAQAGVVDAPKSQAASDVLRSFESS